MPKPRRCREVRISRRRRNQVRLETETFETETTTLVSNEERWLIIIIQIICIFGYCILLRFALFVISKITVIIFCVCRLCRRVVRASFFTEPKRIAKKSKNSRTHSTLKPNSKPKSFFIAKTVTLTISY